VQSNSIAVSRNVNTSFHYNKMTGRWVPVGLLHRPDRRHLSILWTKSPWQVKYLRLSWRWSLLAWFVLTSG